MADEENPLGGGPFGVGPFGPLVGAAAVATAAFNMVVVTTSYPAPRTLFYQANIAPPPQVVAPPPAPVDNINAATGITTSGVRTRTLHYQSKIYGLAPPVTAVVAAPTIEWLQPFTRAAPRPLTETGLYTPFTPSAFPQPTADKWLQPFRRNVAGPFPIHTQPVHAGLIPNLTTTLEWLQAWQKAVPAPPVRHTQPVQGYPYPSIANARTEWDWPVAWHRAVPAPKPVHTQPVLAFAAFPQPTADEWLQPFQRAVPTPSVHHTQPVSGYQPEAAVSNLTTTLEWLRPFDRAAPQPHPALSQPVFGYPYEAAVVSNLTTTLEWMVAWKGPPRVQPVHTQPVHAHLIPNLTTTLEWQIAWQGAKPTKPIHTQPVLGYPYVAVENTIAGLGWIYRFEKAVPTPAVHHTQPDGFLPPSNYRSNWDWPVAWNLAAKTPKPIHTQPVSGYPYVTIENTITGIAWLRGFEKAVPAPPVHHTQPFFGYPYVATPPPSNLTTTLEWQQRWQGPPRVPQQLAAGPVLPPAATPTIANTITGIAWQQAWNGVPARRAVHTQPVLGRSYAAPPTLEWLRGFDRPVQARQVRPTQPVSGYQPAVINLTTTLEWLRGFDRPVAARPVRHTQPGFVYSPPAAVANLTTTLEWLRGFDRARSARPVRHTQPFFGYPYEVAVVEPAEPRTFSVTSTFVLRKTLFYQAWAFGTEPPPPPPEVICVPAFQYEGGFQFDAFQTCQDEQGEPPPEPVIPAVPKFSHGQIFSAGARTGIGVVYPGPEACVPAFQYQSGFQADAFQICDTCTPAFGAGVQPNAFQTCQDDPVVPPTRHLRTTRAMTSTRWKRSRGSIRSRGKSRTTPRDDP